MLNYRKYSGTGNDFILIDNRNFTFPLESRKLIQSLTSENECDGLILLEPPKMDGDVRMRIFNSDGSEAEMCGNGIRCLLQFMLDLGLEKKEYTIETLSGMKIGSFEENLITIDMGPPQDMELGLSLESHMVQFIDTGVPHAVLFVDHLDLDECRKIGKQIRNHPHFGAKGTNVTFATEKADGSLQFCTYERGVEDLTLSCGTGATAAALVYPFVKNGSSPVDLYTIRDEKLTVSFSQQGIDFSNVTMTGPATLIFERTLDTISV